MLNSFIGVTDDVTADAAPAPPRIRPTTVDTSDKDGAVMLAHIFMRVPILEEVESSPDVLVRRPRLGRNGEDEEEHGGTARATVGKRLYRCC